MAVPRLSAYYTRADGAMVDLVGHLLSKSPRVRIRVVMDVCVRFCVPLTAYDLLSIKCVDNKNEAQFH